MSIYNFLQNYHVAEWILIVVLVIYFIIEIHNKREDLFSIFRYIKKGFSKLLSITKTQMRKHYDKCLGNVDYLHWQEQILGIIYGKLIEQYNDDSSNLECEIVCPFEQSDAHLLTDELKSIASKKYEAIAFKAPNEYEYKYPFHELLNKNEVKYKDFIKSNGKYATKKVSKSCRQYYNLLKDTIRFPYNVGYMLNTLNLKKSSSQPLFHFTAKTGLYIDNVTSSHFLEYELYKLYNKEYKKNFLKIKKQSGKYPEIKVDANQLLNNKYLRHRKMLHDLYQNDPYKIFTCGCGRDSLLSVSMMVACKNFNGSYDILRIRRSSNVDAKVGFLQFIPSGGFSALTSDVDFDAQYSNASIAKGLLRELLEECFGEEDFSGQSEIHSETIYNHPVTKKLMKLIYDDTNKSNMYFLGDAISLVTLRHDLCFLLIIDDMDMSTLIKGNEECKNVIQFVDCEHLFDINYWTNYSNNKNDIELLNCTSAAMLQMLKHSKVYSDLFNKK